MAAAAEQLEALGQGVPGDVVLLPSLPEDRFARQRALWLIHAVGNVAISSEQNQGLIRTDASKNLLEGIKSAAKDDERAQRLVDGNVTSDFIERCIKAGFVMDVALEEGQNGEILQDGQTLDSVNANSIQYVGRNEFMKERIKVEARNSFRLEWAKNKGLLEDYYFVVFSLTDDQMTQEQLEEEGFFTETMSCAIQATTMTANGMRLESAFVAGVTEPGGKRHDKEAVRGIGEKLEVDFTEKSTTELLDMPLLIHKSLMPDGVVDVVKMFDNEQGTFFGENKPLQDYLAFKEFCKRRQQEFLPIAQKIRKQLIAERHTFKKPTDATKRLGELTEKYGVENAVTDPTINPRVFGKVAAEHIEEARAFRAVGNFKAAETAQHKAEKTAKSSSCPGAIQDESKENNKEGKDDQSGDALTDETDSKSGKIRCIKCRVTVDKKDVVKAESWRCPHCKYEVDICNGAVLHESEPPEKKKTKVANWLKNMLKLRNE